LLSQPRLYMGGESFKEQVLHHLRFSIEYLRRQALLGPHGQPVNWTSIVSHLYFTENSSFALHALLKEGYFHKLCANIGKESDRIMQEMMLTLSHIFGRKIVTQPEDEEKKAVISRSQSRVFLEPMPAEAAKILRDHNQQTLAIFATYAKTFAEQHVHEVETRLPFTKMSVGAAKADDVSFLRHLAAPSVRSHFVALSGHGDDFSTVRDLCTSTRSGIFLEAAVVPNVELYPDESRQQLNRYLLDFFNHGALQPLSEANGIGLSDVWFDLNDFSLILATIKTSLASHLGLRGEGEGEMLDMGGGDAAENDEDEEEAAVGPTTTTTATTTATTTTTAAPRRRKLADDWDADEDATAAREQLDALVLGDGVDTDDDEYAKLLCVYRAFARLKAEFDAKFH
jgi:hypothetical protein